jgi:hypothetical protein
MRVSHNSPRPSTDFVLRTKRAAGMAVLTLLLATGSVGAVQVPEFSQADGGSSTAQPFIDLTPTSCAVVDRDLSGGRAIRPLCEVG